MNLKQTYRCDYSAEVIKGVELLLLPDDSEEDRIGSEKLIASAQQALLDGLSQLGAREVDFDVSLEHGYSSSLAVVVFKMDFIDGNFLRVLDHVGCMPPVGVDWTITVRCQTDALSDEFFFRDRTIVACSDSRDTLLNLLETLCA